MAGDRGHYGAIVGYQIQENVVIKLMNKKAKGMVEIRDYALWPKHIYDDQPLKDEILALSAGELIELEVDGFRGMWAKMDDGKDGRPTPGIKGIGKAKEHWHGLQDHRGQLVSIKRA